jgi:hypothetical protein
MRNACVLSMVLMVCLAAVAQDKPCIAFAPGSSSATTDIYARDPLATAVTLSGDFGFYSSHRGRKTHEIFVRNKRAVKWSTALRGFSNALV